MTQWTDIVSSLSNFGLLVVASITAWFAYKQLKELVKQLQATNKANEMANLMAVLQLETMVANSRSTWVDAMNKVILNPSSDAKFDDDLVNELREQYFNVLDRLCSCLRRGYIKEKEYQEDYRLQINEVITKYSSSFAPGTRHRNIVIVHDTWKDGKSLTP